MTNNDVGKTFLPQFVRRSPEFVRRSPEFVRRFASICPIFPFKFLSHLMDFLTFLNILTSFLLFLPCGWIFLKKSSSVWALFSLQTWSLARALSSYLSWLTWTYCILWKVIGENSSPEGRCWPWIIRLPANLTCLAYVPSCQRISFNQVFKFTILL